MFLWIAAAANRSFQVDILRDKIYVVVNRFTAYGTFDEEIQFFAENLLGPSSSRRREGSKLCVRVRQHRRKLLHSNKSRLKIACYRGGVEKLC